MPSNGQKKHVGVIGAGVSGLRSAALLLESDFDVTIIEARDYLGGRIRQSNEMGPLEVDVGANWVHSKGDNPIVKLAQETETPLHVWKENTILLDSSGTLVSPELANSTLKRVWDVLELALDRSKAESSSIPSDRSLYDEFKAVTQNQLEKGEMSEYERSLVLGMSQMWGAYVGDGVERQSMRFFFLEDCIEGGKLDKSPIPHWLMIKDDCFIPTNYKKIMAKITALPLQKALILYNHVMTTVSGKRAPGDPVYVTTVDGGQFHFDAVIITCPLGYLKRHRESIVPMTEKVSKAIDNISYGHLEKVLIEFPHSFWEAPAHATKEDAEGGISFVHWLSPSYAPDTNPQRWKLEVVSFNAFEAPYRRNILLFYTFGDCSAHITSQIRHLQPTARDTWLRGFFEPYYSRLPNFDPLTCVPVRFLATQWGNDEFAGYGSYCNFQVGMENAAQDVENLRHGMPEHGIYFAGEHTAPFDGLGTVAGAYNSGDAVARRVIRSFAEIDT